MATAPTFSDLFAAARQETLSRPTRITPEAIDTDGTDVQIAIAAGAAIGEEVGAYMQGELNSLRLATAGSVSDDALEQLGASEYGETRNGSQSAIAYVEFTRQTGGPTLVPAGTIVGTDGGVTFSTVLTIGFASGEVGPIGVAAIASTAGSGGNVAEDSIRNILSTLADDTIEVSQPEKAAGGIGVEPLDDYQARLQTRFQRAPRGTLVAIQESAAANPRVASARASEILDGDAQTGRVLLQILGHGRATNAALGAEIREQMNSVRAAGVPVVTISMNPRLVQVRAFGLRVASGLSPATVLDQAAAAVLSYIQGVEVGATLTLAEILGTLAGISGLQVPAGSLATPTADVSPGPGEFVDSRRELILLTTGAFGFSGERVSNT